MLSSSLQRGRVKTCQYDTSIKPHESVVCRFIYALRNAESPRGVTARYASPRGLEAFRSVSAEGSAESAAMVDANWKHTKACKGL